jgi:FemAB family protein
MLRPVRRFVGNYSRDMLTVSRHLEAALAESGLAASFRSDDAKGWDWVWQSLPYQPVAYSTPMIDYQLEYFRSARWILEDISLVLRNDGHPCGLWPLALGGPPGEARLNSNGGAVFSPLFIKGLSPRTQKRMCSAALKLMRRLSTAISLPPPIAQQGIQPDQCHLGVTEWHRQCLAAGAHLTTRHELYTDLRPPIAEIRAGFRKSFRPLINVGLKEWSVFEMDHRSATATVWAEFRGLHYAAAGRDTRSDKTWDIQFDMLRAGHAFLVGLRDRNDARLVGAGFFQATRDEGMYAVAAYDRALFEKPLGHVVQQRAIELMKSRGLSWYHIGERPYAQDIPGPSDKQLGIAAFKQGFASHQICSYKFALPPLDEGHCGIRDDRT